MQKINIEKFQITEKGIKKLISDIEENVHLLKEEQTKEKQISLIDNISKLRNTYLTLYWISYIGYLKNIKDEKYLITEEIFGKYDGLYNNYIYEMYQIISKIKNKEPLIEKYGKRFIDICKNQQILYNQKPKLFEEERKLRREYRKLLNSPKIKFNNEELSLVRLNKYLQDDNPNIRKSAYDKRFEALLNINDNLSDIFLKIIKNRQEIATSSGFKNYTEYSYVKMNRIDYSEEELYKFKECIIKYFVPLREKLNSSQAKRLGEEKLSYYRSKKEESATDHQSAALSVKTTTSPAPDTLPDSSFASYHRCSLQPL